VSHDRLKVSRIALISKEGHGEARDVARDVALNLVSRGFSVTAFPNLHLKDVDHVPSIKDLASIPKVDLFILSSGDGTILRVLRLTDTTIPCLCINVGGRGILSEIKPHQAPYAIERIEGGDFILDRRMRLSPTIGGERLPPALNEVYLLRQSITRTPTFTLDLGDSATFTQRMDGLLVTTPTGSTGHSYSFGSPFVSGSLHSFLITPVAPITNFPKIIRDSTPMRVMATYGLHLIIDGQETYSVEPNTYITLKRHERDAVFVRFEPSSDFKQLKNLGFD
jgi:NAD+ kinase